MKSKTFSMDRIHRLLDWEKARPTVEKCERGPCPKVERRETDAGILCRKHFLRIKDCVTPGCDKPQFRYGLCRYCLNNESSEYLSYVRTVVGRISEPLLGIIE